MSTDKNYFKKKKLFLTFSNLLINPTTPEDEVCDLFLRDNLPDIPRNPVDLDIALDIEKPLPREEKIVETPKKLVKPEKQLSRKPRELRVVFKESRLKTVIPSQNERKTDTVHLIPPKDIVSASSQPQNSPITEFFTEKEDGINTEVINDSTQKEMIIEVPQPAPPPIPAPPLTYKKIGKKLMPITKKGIRQVNNQCETTETLVAAPPKAQISKLIDSLLAQGIVDNVVVEKAKEIQSNSTEKRRIIDILINDLEVDQELIYDAVARYYSFETVDPTTVYGDKDKLQFIRQLMQTLPPHYYDLAIRRKVLPYELYINGFDKLVIITPDTTHPEVHAVARAFQFQKYEIKHISPSNWNELWRQLAFEQGAKQLGMEIENGIAQLEKEEYENEAQTLEAEVGSSKLGELIESILVDGVRTGASDIHVIPKAAHRTEFHFRIDGRLSLWSAITDFRAEAIIAMVKDRGKNLDRFEKFVSQDGFAQRNIDNKVVRFRFSTMPIYSSDLRGKVESIVIRILRSAETASGIESLGMDSRTLDIYHKAIRRPQGMIVFTGPTGSGKTTSQVAAIKTIMDPSVNIVTIEDPVEYIIEGCRQVKLNQKLDFEGALRGLLRHDPDVVMVGEMRDRITADIAVKLANTGHLIFSTLHTNDSVSAVTRLYNMGIEPFLLAYTVNIIVAQRLIRKLCERCKIVDDNIDKEMMLTCGLTPKEIEETKFYKPVGCVQCINGYRGRTGIFELLGMTKEIRKVILKSKDCIDEDAIRNLALQNGMHTLKQSALELVKKGLTSFENVAGIAIED